MNGKIGIIIQARMGSTRLPNKVLTEIENKPLLKHVMERCSNANVHDIIIATSTNEENDSIENFCKINGYSCFRGSEDNVLDRFYQTAKKFNLDAIIRITGDCPLISPKIINDLIRKFKEEKVDYLSNASKRSFPRGLDCEIFSFKSIEKAHELVTEKRDEEHVTTFIYGNPAIFKIGHLIAEGILNKPNIRLCVDTDNDLKLIKNIYSKLYSGKIIPVEDVIEYLEKNPELIKINQEEELTQQKEIEGAGISQKIEKNLILKKVDSSDIDFLFNLRNKDYIYSISLNPKPITYEEHINWIEPIISNENENRMLYVILCGNKKAGQIRFDVLDKKIVDVNISVLKEYHGKGIANFALEEGIQKMEKKNVVKILAEVFETNPASIKFFEKQGFQRVKDVKSGLRLYEYVSKKFQTGFKVGNKNIGENEPVFIIAERSGNHLQNYDNAVELIKKASEAGADAIKIQTYTPDTISMDKEGINEEIVKEFHTVEIDHPDWKDMSYNKLYEKVYTPWEWHAKLEKVANEYGLPLFSTPFDFTSVDYLEKHNVPIYKIASYDVVNLPLIKKIAETGKPVLMSVGMATEKEIQEAIHTLKYNGCQNYSILHCISSYPTKTENLNLSKIKDLKKKNNCIIGFSDHSLDTNAPAMAVLLGAKIIERHLTLDRKLGGPDASFSSEPHEFKEFVDKVRMIEKTGLKNLFSDFDLAYGEPKYGTTNEFEEGGISARPSIWAGKNILNGDIIKESDLKIVRPGQGLKPKYYETLIGKKVKKNVEKGTPFSLDLIED